MSDPHSPAALLENVSAINTAMDTLVARVAANGEFRAAVVEWLKADLELLEQMRGELRAEMQGQPPEDDCSDPVFNALNATIATKCLALNALMEGAGDIPCPSLAQ